MWCVVEPFVPVFVHEVVNDKTFCKWKVGVDVGCSGLYLDALYKNYLALVGREKETFDVACIVCELLALCAVGVHLPHLATAACI